MSTSNLSTVDELVVRLRADAKKFGYVPGTTPDDQYSAMGQTMWRAAKMLVDLDVRSERLRSIQRQMASSQDGLRPTVLAFARLMERALRVHDDDGPRGWKEDHPDALAARLEEEFCELLRALGTRGNLGAVKEATDVANFAMMIADVCGGLSWRGQGEGDE